MKDKFKKVKDRKKLFLLISEKTGCDPRSIQNNWFGSLVIKIPKNWANWTDTFLDRFLEMEKEKFIDDRNRDIKYFGNL